MAGGGKTAPIAQGEYEYLCDGNPVPVFEHWSLFRLGEKFVLHSAREIPALSVLISARAQVAGGEILRCLLRWCDMGRQKSIAASSYRALGKGINGGVYRVRGAGIETRSVSAEGALYFPLLRIFAGQLLGALAAQDQAEARVLVPWIHDPAQAAKLFEPEISLRRVRFLQSVDAGVSGRTWDSFEYSGGQYDGGAVYDLADGLLQEYHWQQGQSHWTVRLKNLQGSWPGEELWPHAIAPATPVDRLET
ncbi:hypothetical protein [Microbulbifer pacificus]|uniref:Uncharacterized protein n=1 Tax=Microbulbifer pacificus TaxID=407164 RepID=A0AAU0MZE8_9GAMM|nr:hypothetical protein [Microbulbifer pacificus]WOX05888.1 hypothetical protein R5R33_01685 [Microbulbifer pacificus]